MYIINIAADGCSAGDSVVVTVDALPATPAIALTGDSLMSSSPTGNQWYFNGNLLPGETGQYLTLNGAGSYQVQVTSLPGCASAMSSPFIYVGIGDMNGRQTAIIFPNPSGGTVNMSAPWLENRSFEVRVCNTLGKIVYSASNSFRFDLSGNGNGIYYISVLDDQGGSANGKIILNK